MRKPHLLRGGFERFECGRRHVTAHRQIARARLQVLAHGEHVDVVAAQVTHHVDDLVIGFAQPQHQAGFGQAFRAARLEHAQQLERM